MRWKCFVFPQAHVCVCAQCGLLLTDCLASGPPQSVRPSRCPDNDFDIDKSEKVRKRGREREKKTWGNGSTERAGWNDCGQNVIINTILCLR